ncbi:MAG: hypothetical protein LAT84_11225 [Balneolia bacterium]|nr:hypothetical protein [Balneolia bacterium]
MKDQRETNEELFQKYLDGELTGREEQQALRMIADDEEMRDMLRFERSLVFGFNAEQTAESFAVPSGFADKVMGSIGANESETPKAAPQPVMKVVQEEVPSQETSYSRLTVNPFLAAAVVIISIGIGFLLSQPAGQPAVVVEASEISTQFIADEASTIWIRFVYFDEDAESLEVAGDFSDWNPVALNREYAGGKQVWTGMVPVERGEHRYMFVKNGEEWVTDPLAEVQQDDGFGNKNAVLFL